MLSSMMKSMMKNELSAVYTVLKKVNVYTVRQEKKLYHCCILNGSGIEEDTGHEVIYTLNENLVRLGDHITSDYGCCKVDAIKSRWIRMSDKGYAIKETVNFKFENELYVRMIVHVTNQFDDPQGDISRIEFAFGNLTFGVCYIIPWYVWDQRREEIEAIFGDRGNGPFNVIPGDWNVVATYKQVEPYKISHLYI